MFQLHNSAIHQSTPHTKVIFIGRVCNIRVYSYLLKYMLHCFFICLISMREITISCTLVVLMMDIVWSLEVPYNFFSFLFDKKGLDPKYELVRVALAWGRIKYGHTWSSVWISFSLLPHHNICCHHCCLNNQNHLLCRSKIPLNPCKRCQFSCCPNPQRSLSQGSEVLL